MCPHMAGGTLLAVHWSWCEARGHQTPEQIILVEFIDAFHLGPQSRRLVCMGVLVLTEVARV